MASARTRTDALLHAAGKLIGIMLFEAGQADKIEIVADSFSDFRHRRVRHGQSECRVLVHRLPRQQAEMLEHHRHAIRRAGNLLAVHKQRA